MLSKKAIILSNDRPNKLTLSVEAVLSVVMICEAGVWSERAELMKTHL
jgi:hypothetical protein